jgi:hypothetical protein
MAKYDALRDHLAGLPRSQARLTMTFARIETLLGEALPRSAHDYEDWWQGKTRWSRVVKPRPWEQAGWVVDSLDLRMRLVSFRRQD